jgi:molybdenum cofactor cytidylyltransferase
VPLQAESIVINDDWQSGQLSSIQAAIRSLPADETDGMLLFLVDHPLVSGELVKQLITQFYKAGKPIVLPTYRGKRGHPAIFARRLYGELLSAPAGKGARAVVWAHGRDVFEVPTEEEAVVLNLNDRDALRRAEEQFRLRK